MIRLEMFGRLGNQMFRYAAARSLQLKVHQPIEVSFHFVKMLVDPSKAKSYDLGWEDTLRFFQVVPMFKFDGNRRLFLESKNVKQKIVGILFYAFRKLIVRKFNLSLQQKFKWESKWNKLLDSSGLWCCESHYKYKYLNLQDFYLDGMFEDSSIFNNIRDVLIKEFTPINPPLEKNYKLYNLLESTQSVCVSIRTFQEIANNKNQASLYHTYDKSYYIKAMNYMVSKLGNPLFLICSDDIEWVKQNINMSGFNVIYETGNDPIWEKVRIMYSCKHFIISNSTFSWWTMYLSRNKNKVVVAPKRWFNDKYQGHLIEDWMIKI